MCKHKVLGLTTIYYDQQWIYMNYYQFWYHFLENQPKSCKAKHEVSRCLTENLVAVSALLGLGYIVFVSLPNRCFSFQIQNSSRCGFRWDIKCFISFFLCSYCSCCSCSLYWCCFCCLVCYVEGLKIEIGKICYTFYIECLLTLGWVCVATVCLGVGSVFLYVNVCLKID